MRPKKKGLNQQEFQLIKRSLNILKSEIEPSESWTHNTSLYPLLWQVKVSFELELIGHQMWNWDHV